MYNANNNRYDSMTYNRCGKSGILLPFISLGLWHNFGEATNYETSKDMILGAFDMGITHFDIANNYGPPPGSAEECFGKVFAKDLKPYRDEIIVSSKAGYLMWPGPYGEWGSKKSLVASCDQSLKRTGLDYFDIFYHHRPDPNTPIEESMDALASIIRQGKALYVGISNYNPADTKRASEILKGMGIHCLIHQTSYSMFNRHPEDGLLDVLDQEGIGAITFSSLAQGLLTNKYFNGIPEGSRAASASVFLKPDSVTEEKVEKAKLLDKIASDRGQSLSQLALAWCLRRETVCSVIIGASRLSQIVENAKTANNLKLSDEELKLIDDILSPSN